MVALNRSMSCLTQNVATRIRNCPLLRIPTDMFSPGKSGCKMAFLLLRGASDFFVPVGYHPGLIFAFWSRMSFISLVVLEDSMLLQWVKLLCLLVLIDLFLKEAK